MRIQNNFLAVPMALAVISTPIGTCVQSAEAPFDGTWSVFLDCPDIKSDSGLVKGYHYEFSVTIGGGNMTGKYVNPKTSVFVKMDGTVADNGELRIRANGTTGSPEYTVGNVPKGTRYHYSMQGTLGPANGKATRLELRPCTATFTRVNP